MVYLSPCLKCFVSVSSSKALAEYMTLYYKYGRTCSVLGCKNRFTKGGLYNYFRFPLKEPERLRSWLVAIRRENFEPTTNSSVCSAHFLSSDILERPGSYRIQLKPTAVPSVFTLFPRNLRKRTTQSSKFELHIIDEEQTLKNSDNSTISKQVDGPMFILSDILERPEAISSTVVQQDNDPLSISTDVSTQTDISDKTILSYKHQIKVLQQKVRRHNFKINRLKNMLSRRRNHSCINNRLIYFQKNIKES